MATNIIERQNVKVAVARVGVTANGSATLASTTTIKLPPGAMLQGGYYFVVSAATGTTPTLSIVDNATAPNTIASALAIGVANVGGILDEAGEAANYYPTGTTLSFTTGGTTPAAGDVLVAVHYIVLGRCDEIYGTDV